MQTQTTMQAETLVSSPEQTLEQATTRHHNTRGILNMNTIKITILAACIGLTMTALEGQVQAVSGTNALNPNALNPNALNPNALNPNGLGWNAMANNAITPNRLTIEQHSERLPWHNVSHQGLGKLAR